MPFYYTVKRTLLNSHPLRQGRAYNSERETSQILYKMTPSRTISYNNIPVKHCRLMYKQPMRFYTHVFFSFVSHVFGQLKLTAFGA